MKKQKKHDFFIRNWQFFFSILVHSSFSKVSLICRKSPFGANTVFLDKDQLHQRKMTEGKAFSWKYLVDMLVLNVHSAMCSGLLCEVEILEESGFSLPTKKRVYNLKKKYQWHFRAIQCQGTHGSHRQDVVRSGVCHCQEYSPCETSLDLEGECNSPHDYKRLK